MFAARTSDKRGRKRQQTFAATRELAAKAVFILDPKAKSCSTAHAHRQSDGRFWNTGSDMRWHKHGEQIDA